MRRSRLQNYFRMYDKLAGMTGTAVTEDAEFREIYNLPVMVIPTNQPMIRDDRNDLIYRTVDAKFNAVAEEIAERNVDGQPCLVGTISIENSERLSRALSKRGVDAQRAQRQVPRARSAHRRAGRPSGCRHDRDEHGRSRHRHHPGRQSRLPRRGAAHRARHRPGRGDRRAAAEALSSAKAICADEHIEVVNAGGLAVIGTERHDSRRIDNQLRGRSGRQGDPGASQFYLSLEDDLMRLFGGDKMDRISNMMQKTNLPDDLPIQAGMVSKAIESAQRQVEAMNFGARKHVLEYDDVMNKQREVIYAERNRILDGKDIHGRVTEMMGEVIIAGVLDFCPGEDLLRGVGLGRPGAPGSATSPGSRASVEKHSTRSRTRMSLRTRSRSERSRSTPRRKRRSAPTLCANSSVRSCCASSTRVGWNTCSRWTI